MREGRLSFDEVLRLLEEYNEEYDHCNVPRNHKTASGIPLGEMVQSIRKGDRKTTPEQKAKLDSIGFVWKLREIIPFDQVLRLLEEFNEEYDHCDVPYTHETASGIPLGVIVHSIRKGARKTTPEQKAKLDSIGFVWTLREIIPFDQVLRLLEEFKEEYGHCDVPYAHKTASEISLGILVSNIRSGSRKTTAEQKAKLDSIGFVWKLRVITPFEKVLELLQEYKEEYGHCNVPRNHKTASDFPLGMLVANIRHGKRKTTAEEKAQLDAIGFPWKARRNKK